MAESRTKRWETAVANGKTALEALIEQREELQDKLNEAAEDLLDKFAIVVKEVQELMEGNADKVREALETLEGIRTEYQEWEENLPENLSSSALADKLSEVVNGHDFDHEIDSEITVPSIDDVELWEWNLDDLDTLVDVFDEAEAADLPLGFGRD